MVPLNLKFDATSLAGKVVLVTGASRGIGAAATRAFLAAGANVGMAARSVDALAALEQETGAIALPCDVGNFMSIQAAVDKMCRIFGRLDVLINNAGTINPIGLLSEIVPTDFSRLIDTNLKGVFHGIRAAVPVMRTKGGGTIITVGSGAAQSPLEGWSAYCSSKAGALMLTRVADIEERANGLRVMSLSPGTVATDMQLEIKASGLNPVSQLDWSSHIPPETAASALVWMCTPDADDWVGQEVSLRNPEICARLGL